MLIKNENPNNYMQHRRLKGYSSFLNTISNNSSSFVNHLVRDIPVPGSTASAISTTWLLCAGPKQQKCVRSYSSTAYCITSELRRQQRKAIPQSIDLWCKSPTRHFSLFRFHLCVCQTLYFLSVPQV